MISSAKSQTTDYPDTTTPLSTLAPFTCPDNNNGFYPLPECFHSCCRFKKKRIFYVLLLILTYLFVIFSSYYVCNQGTAYLAVSISTVYAFLNLSWIIFIITSSLFTILHKIDIKNFKTTFYSLQQCSTSGYVFNPSTATCVDPVV